jgi:prevent-host-death family protein
MKTRTIPAGEFKAKCLALMDEVAATGDEIVITKRGKPVARLSAEQPRQATDLSGSVIFEGDIVSPLGVRWDTKLDRP